MFYGADRGPAGERFSLVSELVSSYFAEMDNMHEYGDERFYKGDPTSMRSKVHLADDARPVHEHKQTERKPQLSWFLTVFLLLVVTVASLDFDELGRLHL